MSLPTVASADAGVSIDTVHTLTYSKLSSNQVSLTWHPVLGASKYTVHYTGGTEVVNDTTASILGLTDCNTYSIYVTPDSSLCSNNSTDTLKFMTPPQAPLLTLSAGTGSHVNATWTGNSQYKYKLYYGNTTSLPSLYVVTVRGTSYAIQVNTTQSRTLMAYVVVDSGSACTVKPISPTAYYNVAGNSCDNTPPVITYKSLISKRLSVSWSGSASDYYLYYKRLSDLNWYIRTSNHNSITFSVPQNECYIIMLVNVCSKSPVVFGYSSAIDTLCPSSPCAAPANLLISRITCKSFYASWNTVPGCTRYSFSIGRVTNGVVGTFEKVLCRTNSFSMRSIGRGRTYEAYVTAIGCSNSTVESAPSNVETFSTLSMACKDAPDDTTGIISFSGPESDINNLAIYPNPNNGKFDIRYFNRSGARFATIEVVNLIGQVIVSKQVSIDADELIYELNLANQSTGTYFIRVSCGQSLSVSRVAVIR